MGYWQGKNWDPSVGSTEFEEFCEALSKPLHGSALRAMLDDGNYDESTKTVSLPGGLSVPLVVYNYAQYIKDVSIVSLGSGDSPDSEPLVASRFTMPGGRFCRRCELFCADISYLVLNASSAVLRDL